MECSLCPAGLPQQGLAAAPRPWLCDGKKRKEDVFHTEVVIVVGAVSVIFRDAVLMGEGCSLERIAFKCRGSVSDDIKGHWAHVESQPLPVLRGDVAGGRATVPLQQQPHRIKMGCSHLPNHPQSGKHWQY